jgi:DNA-binding GntR family transcriptional regulator
MFADDDLVSRIRGEYREMPGMRLTLPQAARLWQADPGECARALGALVEEGILTCTEDGAFIATPDITRARMRPQGVVAADRSSPPPGLI